MRTTTIIVAFAFLFCGIPTFVIAVDQPISTSADAFLRQLGKTGSAFNLVNFVEKAGYPIEEHNVTTEDGYILLMHRIPHGRNNSDNSSRPVALFMPGSACTSAVYLVIGPGQSLAMQLADQGYDVWLGNSRGNIYSRHHETLDPSKDKEYWNFSFEEMGTKDLPAIIDYVLKTTGQENLTYIGQSQGTTISFVMLSMLPEYNNKMVLVVALGPIAYMNNVKSPIVRFQAENLLPLKIMGEALGLTLVLDHDVLTNTLINLFCTPGGVNVCPLLTSLIIGFDDDQSNTTTQELFLQSFPAGTSFKTLIHYGQEYHSGQFRRYDYGMIRNIIKYRAIAPPDYDLSKIAAPVSLYYGQNDWLVSVKDVERFADKLNNVVRKPLAYKQFTHGDFLLAKDVNNLLYKDVINLINNYNGKEELTT